MVVDLITLAIILGMAIWGYKSGFVRSIFNLGYFIVAAIVATFTYPVITTAILNTQFAAHLRDNIAKYFLQHGTGALNLKALPSFLAAPINDGVTSTTDALATSVTQTLVSLLSIVLVFILVKFGLKLAVKILNLIASLPVIRLFNKSGGFIIGIINGFIVVYLLLAVSTLFVTSDFVGYIIRSHYTSTLYQNNLLLQLIFR